MSPFFKLLASASSLAIVTSSFLYSKVAEAFDGDGKKKNVPIVRVDSISPADKELSDLIDTMVSAKDEQKQDETVQLAQANVPNIPQPFPQLPDNAVGPNGNRPGGPGNGPAGNGPDFTGNAGGDAS